MATEEIEISELEYREILSGDDLMPVETSTNTFATSLTQIKDWLKSFFVSKTGNEEIRGYKTFKDSLLFDLSVDNKDVIKTTGSNNGELKISQYYNSGKIYARITNKNKNTDKDAFLDIVNGDNGETLIQINSEKTRCPASSEVGSIVTTTGISKSQNGYVKLGNGIIIQWGAIGKAGSGTITFPTAFAGTNYTIAFTGIWNSTGVSYTTETETTTSIFYRCSRSDVSGKWLAIGY